MGRWDLEKEKGTLLLARLRCRVGGDTGEGEGHSPHTGAHAHSVASTHRHIRCGTYARSMHTGLGAEPPILVEERPILVGESPTVSTLSIGPRHITRRYLAWGRSRGAPHSVRPYVAQGVAVQWSKLLHEPPQLE